MSRVESIDVPLLRARLLLAFGGDDLKSYSPFLIAIGALLLGASSDNPAELGLWQSLLDLQALEEGVSGDELLEILATVTTALGDA